MWRQEKSLYPKQEVRQEEYSLTWAKASSFVLVKPSTDCIWPRPALGRTICCTQFTNLCQSYENHTHKDTQNNIWPVIWVPHAPIKLTYKINHYRYFMVWASMSMLLWSFLNMSLGEYICAFLLSTYLGVKSLCHIVSIHIFSFSIYSQRVLKKWICKFTLLTATYESFGCPTHLWCHNA